MGHAMVAKAKLRAVGYWHADDGDFLPDPRLLVEARWRLVEKPLILTYLRAGATYAKWRGFSYCRFGCRERGLSMGSLCLTDGLWVWPEGLAHYVAHHEICLP